MIDANEIESHIDETKVDREECIRDVTDSPKDWEDFWYSPELITWGSDALDEVWETMDKIEPLTPPTTNEFRPQKQLSDKEIESMKIAVNEQTQTIHPDKMEDFAEYMVQKFEEF